MADARDERDFFIKSVSAAASAAIPRRSGQALRRFADFAHPQKPDDGTRCLSVGRGITLSGAVTSCDKLVIEGSVEANLTNCRIVEIGESGLFKGSTTIEEAEVRGRFEGELVVCNRLLITATGRVSGTIRYGQIEIECGGQIFGDIQARSAGEAHPWDDAPLSGQP
jgi:cytoskeletal protein CcmA (bactofilin family)